MAQEIVARNGRVVHVLAICRISTVHQKEESLEDQEALLREYMDRNCKYEYEMTVISSRGSGERVDSQAYKDALAAVESGEYDLVILEDSGRLCRRVHAILFFELCEDHDTRFISINDNIDTAEENWRLGSFFASIHHEQHNRDVSNRVRRSLRNQFVNGGGASSVAYYLIYWVESF